MTSRTRRARYGLISQEHSLCPDCDTDTWHQPIVKTRRGWVHKDCAERRSA